MKIQFLLLGDGASHKFLGINPIRGLKLLGINAEYWFPSRGTGKLLENPDYVFVLKPNKSDEQMILKYKKNGSKIIFIVSDQRLSKEDTAKYDFYVACTTGWQEEFRRDYPDKYCYLLEEEWEHFTTKIHKPDSFKIVTMGNKQCLFLYLKPILDIIKTKYKDISIVSSWGMIKDKYYEMFKEFNLVNFIPNASKMMDEDRDKIAVEQFTKYDVGIIGQQISGGDRPPTRLKGLLYAGLPIIASASESHSNIWFNDSKAIIFQVKKPEDWIKWLDHLQDYKIRQEVTDYNYPLIKQNARITKSGENILKAIKEYENETR